MARIPKRLHGPSLVSNAAATKYTVPAATKTVLRHVHISNPSASTVKFTLSIGTDAVGVRLYDAFSITAGQIRDDYWYEIAEAAEIIQAFADTNNILVITLNGDELILG